MKRVLVTGANGFVGHALVKQLMYAGWDVNQAIRNSINREGVISIGNIDAGTDWSSALAGCFAVVHLAARVHMPQDHTSDAQAELRAINVDGTLKLAQGAATAGVRRFVFLSSVKVNGEGQREPYRETDTPAPQDQYAMSKWEAEQGLREIEARTGLEVVILRPPLVYGPGVKANFLRLMQAVSKGWPLPFGAVANRRSLIFLGNLVDAIQSVLEHPLAAGRTYLLSDGEVVSSAELIRQLARALGRCPQLVSVPESLLRFMGSLTGRRAEVDRVLGSLFVDGSLIRNEVGWVPPFGMQFGLEETARVFLQNGIRPGSGCR